MKIWAFLLLSMLAGATANGPSSKEKRIYGGKDCPKNERQYHVYIEYPVNATTVNKCGGSLISKHWVITAAHCGDGTKPLTLIFGPHDMNVWKTASVRVVTVPGERQFAFTENNNNIKQHHDIMLLMLDPPLDPLPNIKPINLPTKPCNRPAIGEKIKMAGWGNNKADNSFLKEKLRSSPVHLQCAELDLVQCTGHIQDNYTRNNFNTFCYSRKDVTTCKGDSGGGVEHNGLLIGVHNGDSRYVCGDEPEGHDVCYTPTREWIDETMKTCVRGNTCAKKNDAGVFKEVCKCLGGTKCWDARPDKDVIRKTCV